MRNTEGSGPVRMNRRDWLKLGSVGVAGLSGASVLTLARQGGAATALERLGLAQDQDAARQLHEASHALGVYGDHPPGDGFDPMAFLTDFQYGETSTDASGRTIREHEIVAIDREIEVAPGVWFPAWTYNGQVPGPTLRCTEGDVLRVHFQNAGSHPHTIHFHGVHAPAMDGVFPVVQPGEHFTYEFVAKPFGIHPYHCHAVPLKRHIHKGLYGTLIVDPKEGRPPARELVIVMNGFDTNFDGENEIYAANTAAFYYQKNPIKVGVGDLVRVYLSNMTEFDPINSLHLHAAMFKFFRTGTRMDQYDFTDTVMMCQGERGILEVHLENEGLHMFHAHQSEFSELGWMRFFEAVTHLAANAGITVHRDG